MAIFMLTPPPPAHMRRGTDSPDPGLTGAPSTGGTHRAVGVDATSPRWTRAFPFLQEPEAAEEKTICESSIPETIKLDE